MVQHVSTLSIATLKCFTLGLLTLKVFNLGWNAWFEQLELHKNDPNIMKPLAFLRQKNNAYTTYTHINYFFDVFIEWNWNMEPSKCFQIYGPHGFFRQMDKIMAGFQSEFLFRCFSLDP